MPEVFSNPYALADTALSSWVGRDTDRIAALLGREPTERELDRCALGADDAIEGLYFESSG